MGNEVEKLVVLRRQWLLGTMLSTVLWLGSKIVQDALPIGSVLRPFCTVGYIVGIAVFAVYMVQIGLFLRKLQQNKLLNQILNDERIETVRMQAAGKAFGEMVAASALIGIPALLFPQVLNGVVVAETLLLVGICVFTGTFLKLDGKED